jgi:hypothetical protein
MTACEELIVAYSGRGVKTQTCSHQNAELVVQKKNAFDRALVLLIQMKTPTSRRLDNIYSNFPLRFRGNAKFNVKYKNRFAFDAILIGGTQT